MDTILSKYTSSAYEDPELEDTVNLDTNLSELSFALPPIAQVCLAVWWERWGVRAWVDIKDRMGG